MKIIDISCFYGPWAAYPVKGDIVEVAAELRRFGIACGLVSPLAAVWCRNPQAYNRELLEVTRPHSGLMPVPILDPSIPTWREEVETMRRDTRVVAFRVFLNYTQFNLGRRDTLDDFFGYFNQIGVPLIIQRRMEDPRYNHHKAVVADADVNYLQETAMRFPELKLILGGMSAGVNAARALAHAGIYLDTAQMDSMACIRRQIDAGLLPRLLFGTHVPLFETYAAFGRVLHDVSDSEAEQILYGNAARLFGL